MNVYKAYVGSMSHNGRVCCMVDRGTLETLTLQDGRRLVRVGNLLSDDADTWRTDKAAAMDDVADQLTVMAAGIAAQAQEWRDKAAEARGQQQEVAT